MADFFKKVKKTNAPVAISGKEEGAFFTGFVREADEEFVLLEAVSPSGRSDGWACIRIEEVARADVATEYLNMLAKVYVRYGELPAALKISARDVLGSFIDQAIKNKWLCTVELGFETLDKVTGYFVDRNFDTVEMNLMGANGKKDGYTSFDFEEIVFITAAGEREKYLETVIEILEEERLGSADSLFDACDKSGGRQAKKNARSEKELRRHTEEQNAEEDVSDDVQNEKEKDKNGRIISFPKKDD